LFTTRLVICANKVNRFNFDFTGTLKNIKILRFPHQSYYDNDGCWNHIQNQLMNNNKRNIDFKELEDLKLQLKHLNKMVLPIGADANIVIVIVLGVNGF